MRLNPNYAEAFNNRGIAYVRQGRLDEAVADFRHAVQIKPDYARATSNLGNALKEQGHADEAVTRLRDALRLDPNYLEGYTNLGAPCVALGELDEAVATLQQALRVRPNDAATHYHVGIARGDQGDLDMALASYGQAIQLNSDFADAHWNRALAWLLKGNYPQGWTEYEWRWECKEFCRRPFSQPLWDGSPLAGRTILLYAEQGLGDTLQFVRYALPIQQRGGKVVVECQDLVLQLLTGCPGIERLVEAGAPLPDFDVHAPLLSLPASWAQRWARCRPLSLTYLPTPSLSNAGARLSASAPA